jgi:site-specific DNA recombinase
VEKADRLYRNLKDWVTIDDLEVEVHFVKEGVVLSHHSRSSEKFMHGIKVLTAKNYIDNRKRRERGRWKKRSRGFGCCHTHRSATAMSLPTMICWQNGYGLC